MKRRKSIISFLVALLGSIPAALGLPWADSLVVPVRDSVMINFRQSKWNLDRSIGDNAAALDSIDRRLTEVFNDSVYRLRRVSVAGGASPEGSVAFNKFLSEHRAQTLFKWFDKYSRITEFDKTFTFYGRDWEGVLRLAEADSAIPYRDETLELLATIVDEKRASGGEDPPRSLERMKRLRSGVPYRYLYRHIFPTVRASKVVLDFDRVALFPRRPNVMVEPQMPILSHEPVMIADIIWKMPPAPADSIRRKPFYMDVRTNLVYDALAVPNIGVEFYLGKDWSIAANYMHAWWSYDPRHRYWRIYGGEINVRRWWGEKALEKPLTGHHFGAYIQALTYDFELGGKAYMGGKPGGTIFDLAHFGAGVEYGYSHPIGRRLNLDFSIGVGYIGGKVHEFVPDGDRYLWTATKNRRWFGPTKIEVALVWLIGRGNFNKKKGGER